MTALRKAFAVALVGRGTARRSASSRCRPHARRHTIITARLQGNEVQGILVILGQSFGTPRTEDGTDVPADLEMTLKSAPAFFEGRRIITLPPSHATPLPHSASIGSAGVDMKSATGRRGRAFGAQGSEAPPSAAIGVNAVSLGLNVAVTLPSKVVTGMVPLYPYLSGIEGSKISVYTSCVT
jgi:hypothetical protein